MFEQRDAREVVAVARPAILRLREQTHRTRTATTQRPKRGCGARLSRERVLASRGQRPVLSRQEQLAELRLRESLDEYLGR